MRAGYVGVLLSVVVAAAAAYEVRDPFQPQLHGWWVAVIAALAAAYLLATGVATALGAGGSRTAALCSLGGALLGACLVFAAVLVGPPSRVPAAPGQLYRPRHAGGVAIDFPDVGFGGAGAAWPDSVTVVDGATRTVAHAGDVVRAGPFVFSVAAGPAAAVDARAPHGAHVTITQPDAPAFLSRILLFPGTDLGQPEDFFRVPALHRDVQVDYYAGLPSRNIDIPFLALRISEENGGSLYEGVAVSSRPLSHAGVTLGFAIGSYPAVTQTGAPPWLPFWAGIAMTASGLTGHALELVTAGRARRGRADRGSRATS